MYVYLSVIHRNWCFHVVIPVEAILVLVEKVDEVPFACLFKLCRVNDLVRDYMCNKQDNSHISLIQLHFCPLLSQNSSTRYF